MKKFIFDFDGLLVNTERLAFRVWQQAGEKFGFEVDESWVIDLMGKNQADSVKIYMDKFADEKRAMEIRKYRVELMLDILQSEGTEAMPGAFQLLDFLKEKGYEMALATGSSEKRVGYTFLSVPMEKYFNYIITGDKVAHGKPDPEIFLNAAAGLHTNPKNTIVLEDSAQGILAAKSIDATAILVADIYKPTEEIRNKCDFVFSSLTEVIDNFEEVISR